MYIDNTNLFGKIIVIILKKNRRFTIIELLIVIIIIGILSTMLLPSLSKARMSALVSLCKSNERQLMFATMTYADDYQDILPTCNKSNGIENWFSFINPSGEAVSGRIGTYLDDSLKVYYCPANPNPRYSGLPNDPGPLFNDQLDSV